MLSASDIKFGFTTVAFIRKGKRVKGYATDAYPNDDGIVVLEVMDSRDATLGNCYEVPLSEPSLQTVEK